jgi:hypothetical protein
MAQRKRKGAKENPKASERQRTGGDTAGKIIQNVALFAIPGGGFARISMTGGKIASGALATLRKMFPKARRVANPSKAQIDKAKPVSALKPPAKPKPPAKNNQVIEGKVVEKSSKPVRTTKRTDSKPSNAVATRPRTDVKKPGTGVMEVRPGATPKRGMKTVQGTDKTRDLNKIKSNIKAAQRAGNASRVKKLVAAAVAAGLVTSAAMLTGGRDKATATGGTTTKPTPKPAKPTPKKKPGATTPDTKKISPKGPPGSTTPDTKKISPKGPPGATTPNTKKMPPKGRPITAGKGTGFGPKGNIFPSNAAERAALMKMYGGTGSAAAKAAAAGKQGDLKAGKAAYEKAKRERLKGKK